MLAQTWHLVGIGALVLSFVSIGVRGTSYPKRDLVQIVSAIAAVYLWAIFSINAFAVGHLVSSGSTTEIIYQSNPGIGYFGMLWGFVLVIDLLAGVIAMLSD